MSKFIYGKSLDPIKNYISGFSVSQGVVLVKKKASIDSCPFYVAGNNSILGVGTYIYNGVTGLEALALILRDFVDGSSVSRLKKLIKGIYSFVINKNEIVYVFNDYYGLYDTFYCHKLSDQSYLVGNDIILLSKVSGHHEIAEYPFIEHCLTTGSSGRESLVKNVYRLLGNEYLAIDGDTLNLNRIVSADYNVIVPQYTQLEKML